MVRPRVFQGNAGVAVLRTGMTPGWISTLAGVRHPHTRTYEDKEVPRGFERSLDSESRVLTVTPRDQVAIA